MSQEYGKTYFDTYRVTMKYDHIIIGVVKAEDGIVKAETPMYMSGWRYIERRKFDHPTIMNGTAVESERRVNQRIVVDRARETASALALWHAFEEFTAMEFGETFHNHVGRAKGASRCGWRFTVGQLFAGVQEARIHARRLDKPVPKLDFFS